MGINHGTDGEGNTEVTRPETHWWQSIRLKAVLIILLMVVPLVVAGIFGIFYYQSVIRQNIDDNTLATAKTVSTLTPYYMQTSQLYLKGIADRPLVIKAIRDDDRPFLHSMAAYTNSTNRINSVYFTDANGVVLESTPEIAMLIGSNSSYHSYVSSVLKTGEPVIDDVEPGYNNTPVVPIALPVKDENGTVLGVLVGTVDMNEFAYTIGNTMVKRSQNIYIVNRTGYIIVHSNPLYLAGMRNFSSVPAVQRVLQGNTGVGEYYDPINNESVLGAYAPLQSLGWGVVVALPRDVAYQPVWNTIWPMAAVLAILTLMAMGLGIYFGNNIVAPITSLSHATQMAFKSDEYKRLIPLRRKDEIGDLGRSFNDMVQTIKRARGELSDQKRRAELYLDLMSHDINNMMQTGIGFLELALGRVKKGSEEGEFIGKALESMQNCANLIENVRKLQKAETDDLRHYPIDVCQLLSDVRSDFLKVPSREVTINLTHYCECMVNANKLLKDVFINIVGNAIKHSTGPITIDITVWDTYEDEQRYCNISIEDNGPGIPPALKSRLFTRFQRGATEAYGKGLGLYLVKTLVEDFHGKIWVEDRIPGDYTQGSKFVVRLPVIGN